ncbi:MAG: hypothetical protein ACRD9S_23500 [Pyrinomonadaceae bacterium]
MACVLGIVGAVGAQERRGRSQETGIALEVTYLAGQAPTYQTVPWASAPRGWVWYARFGRVAGWKLPAGAQPIRAVRIVPFLDEEAVESPYRFCAERSFTIQRMK